MSHRGMSQSCQSAVAQHQYGNAYTLAAKKLADGSNVQEAASFGTGLVGIGVEVEPG
jgi:hypothetical protein